MAFSRKAIAAIQGITPEQVDAIMTLHGTSMADYLPKTDVQGQIDAALNDYKAKNPAKNLTDDPEYKKVFAENAKLKAFGTDDFKSVKAPYRDIVWDKLDHAENHKPYAEQISELSKTMPDLFAADDTPPAPPAKPAFGAAPKGSAPDGQAGTNFADFMSFIPKKK